MKTTFGHLYISYQIRQYYSILKLGSTVIRIYNSRVLEFGHNSNPKAIKCYIMRQSPEAVNFSLSYHVKEDCVALLKKITLNKYITLIA